MHNTRLFRHKVVSEPPHASSSSSSAPSPSPSPSNPPSSTSSSPVLSLPSSFDDDLLLESPPSSPPTNRQVLKLQAQMGSLRQVHATQEEAWQKDKIELQAQIQSILQLQPHDLDTNITQGNNNTRSSAPIEHIYRTTHTWAAPLKEDLQQTHKQLQETQRRVVGLSDQLEFHLHENERLVKENDLLRNQRDKAESLVEETQHQMKQPAQKEDIHTQLQALQQNHQDLQRARDTQLATLKEALAAKEASERRLAEASHCQEMLALDKDYLGKEVERLTTENTALQQTLETAQQDLSTLKQGRDEWNQQLMDLKEEAQHTYQDRLDDELAHLREAQTKEWTQVTTNTRDILERENASLREARDDAKVHSLRLQRELQQLQLAHDDLLLRFAKSETHGQGTMAELRAENKLITFELARVQSVCEETMLNLRSAQRLNETFREEVQEKRHDAVKMEAEMGKKEHELHLALEKVQSYEVLETQLDNAVSSFAAACNNTNNTSNKHKRLLPSIFASSTASWGAITSGPRRLQHAILLATRLQACEKNLLTLQEEAKQATENAHRWQRKAEEMQQLLLHAAQPGKYVVELLREKDKEVEGARQAWQAMKGKVEEAQTEMRRLREEMERGTRTQGGRSRRRMTTMKSQSTWQDQQQHEQERLLLLSAPSCAGVPQAKWHVKKCCR